MHHKMLEEATPEQLKSFLYDSFDELKRTMPELYEEMECELYEHIYGEHFTRWKYEEAVGKFDNKDGSKGAHWKAEDIVSLAKNKGLRFEHFNEWDFAYAMNMVYSDYFGSVPDSLDTYFKLAVAFIEDKDAPNGKAYRYYKAMSH